METIIPRDKEYVLGARPPGRTSTFFYCRRVLGFAAILAALATMPALANDGSRPDPMLTDDEYIWWFSIRDIDSASIKSAMEAELARMDRAENRYAAEVAWETVNRRFTQVGIGLTGWEMFLQSTFPDAIGGPMADMGLILSAAQLYRDLLVEEETPDGAGLQFAKNLGLWAAGRFGWSSLSAASGVIGIGDYLLTELGQAGVSARQTPIRVAFENYFGTGRLVDLEHRNEVPGFLTDEEWLELFWKKRVEDLPGALRTIRGHFSSFWRLNPSDMRSYCVPQRVYHELGFPGTWLLRAAGGIDRPFLSYSRADREVIENDFIREVLEPKLRVYFTEVLPEKLEREAKTIAARRLNQIRESLNATCGVGMRVSGLPDEANQLVAWFGVWRYPLEPKNGNHRVLFTRYAYLMQQDFDAELRLGWRAPDGRQSIVSVPVDNPLDWKRCRQVVDVELPTLEQEEPDIEEAPKEPERYLSRKERCLAACLPGRLGQRCRDECECVERCHEAHPSPFPGLVGAGTNIPLAGCVAACQRGESRPRGPIEQKSPGPISLPP